VFRYANAGHLPPLLKWPDGHVTALDGGGSTVIGAPSTETRAQAEEHLAAGSTLLLFTDGLVEVPKGSLIDSLDQLATTVTQHKSTDPADALCERVLSAMPGGQLHDDIAILALRMNGPGTPKGPAEGSTAVTHTQPDLGHLAR
jgi:serine phosphatase RsbU (regulator of sigma subunit)